MGDEGSIEQIKTTPETQIIMTIIKKRKQIQKRVWRKDPSNGLSRSEARGHQPGRDPAALAATATPAADGDEVQRVPQGLQVVLAPFNGGSSFWGVHEKCLGDESGVWCTENHEKGEVHERGGL